MSVGLIAAVWIAGTVGILLVGMWLARGGIARGSFDDQDAVMLTVVALLWPALLAAVLIASPFVLLIWCPVIALKRLAIALNNRWPA